MLKSERIALRPVEIYDIELLVKWFNDMEICQYLATFPPINEIEMRDWLEGISKQPKSEFPFIIEFIEPITRTQIRIGICRLYSANWIDRKAILGITIGEKSYWDKGLGQEATLLILKYGFDRLNLHRIESAVVENNGKSIKMHIKLGFTLDGVKPEAVFRNGKFLNIIMFGILENELENI